MLSFCLRRGRKNNFMCTCITYKNGDFYFGRNMDLEYSFGECVVITPRSFPLHFRHNRYLPEHYAMIGMAAGSEAFPLYAEAVNEKGLCMAGLNFRPARPSSVNAFSSTSTASGRFGSTLAKPIRRSG